MNRLFLMNSSRSQESHNIWVRFRGSPQYRYGFVELHVDGQRFGLQPIDYVGETVLGGGEFTFRVDVDTSSPFGVSLVLED